MNRTSQGVPKDTVKAVEQGHARAQFNLSLAYDIGTGVPKNPVRAAEWHRRAAEQC